MDAAAAATTGASLGEQKLAAAHGVLLKTRGLQFDFPSPPTPPRPPEWLEGFGRFLEALGPVVRILMWGALILGGLMLLGLVVRLILDLRRAPKRAVAAPVDWRPDPTQARALLADADRLAAEGRFDEATHLLLFRSIDDLGAKRPGLVRPALTSRDIAGLEILPEGPRGAFARIAQAVERSFFGGKDLDAGDFARCREDYQAFALQGGWV